MGDRDGPSSIISPGGWLDQSKNVLDMADEDILAAQNVGS